MVSPDVALTPSKSVMTSSKSVMNGEDGRNALPPSLQVGLPSNIFVSSAEFSAPRRDGKGRKGRRSHVGNDDSMDVSLDYGGQEVISSGQEEVSIVEGAYENGQNILAEPSAALGDTQASDEMNDVEMTWKKISIAFDALDEVTMENLKTIEQGTIIAWKVSDKTP